MARWQLEAAGKALTQHGRWMAAVLASGTQAVLSHRSAAALWGIRIKRQEAHLQLDEVTIHEAIPFTTVPRTIFDLAASAPDAVEPALRQAEYLRLYDSLSLPDLLNRYPGHRGNRAIRTALARLEETPGRTRSPFEHRFLAFLDRYSLPRPHFNAGSRSAPTASRSTASGPTNA